ncbi:hypothetical protein Tco_1007873 [Tanacetum coccineum]
MGANAGNPENIDWLQNTWKAIDELNQVIERCYGLKGKPLIDDKGFVDSGCSRHITRNIACLVAKSFLLAVVELVLPIVFEEEQARFNADQEARFKAEQEQERIDFETALELQKQLDEREEVTAKVDQAHDIDWIEEEIVQQDDVIAEQAVKESSKTAGGRRNKSLARKRAKETLSEESAKKLKLEDDTEKEELQVYLNIVPEEKKS